MISRKRRSLTVRAVLKLLLMEKNGEETQTVITDKVYGKTIEEYYFNIYSKFISSNGPESRNIWAYAWPNYLDLGPTIGPLAFFQEFYI